MTPRGMNKDVIRAAARSPYLWASLGMSVPPFNVILAAVNWAVKCVRRKSAREAAECLNVQITYTLMAYLPILGAFMISAIDNLDGAAVPYSNLLRVATGFPLGIISLAGIVTLVILNIRTLAHRTLGTGNPRTPRIRFVSEPL